MDDGNKITKAEAAEAPAKAGKGKKANAPRKAKEPRVKKEKAAKEAMVVFAMRMTESERAKIHTAAGSGKTTRLVRAAALAVADGNLDALKELIANRATTK